MLFSSYLDCNIVLRYSVNVRIWREISGSVVLAVMAAALVLWRYGQLDPRLFVDQYMNIWFDADIPRVFSNLLNRGFGHGATFKHPVFSIVGWSIATLLRLSGFSAHAAIGLMLLVNAALFIILLGQVLRLIGVGFWSSFGFALLALLSVSFQTFFSIPETFGFGATTLVIALLPLALRIPLTGSGWWLWMLAAAASLTMTITNFLVGFVAVGVGANSRDGELLPAGIQSRSNVKAVLSILFSAVVLILIVASVQRLTFGGAGMFINVRSLAAETKFVTGVRSPLSDRFSTLIIGPVVQSLPVLPASVIFDHGYLRAGLNADSASEYDTQTFVAVLLWLLLLATGAWAIISDYRHRNVGVAALASLTAMTLLHLVYGLTVFLYVAHFLPLLIIIAAHSRFVLGKLLIIPLAALLLLTGLSSMHFSSRSHFDSANLADQIELAAKSNLLGSKFVEGGK